MFGLGTQELLIFGVIAVLLFGKRLPEVARSMGSSYREFRRGLSDIQRQVDVRQYLEEEPPETYSSSSRSGSQGSAAATEEPSVPKFDLPPSGGSDSSTGLGESAEPSRSAGEPAREG